MDMFLGFCGFKLVDVWFVDIVQTSVIYGIAQFMLL